jgi:DNA-binding NarL/FixJ family response regulator
MSETADPIRVLIADDEGLIRGSLRVLLGAEPDLEVVGEAADGEQAVRLAVERRPDVVLMDLRMPGVDGIEATARICAQHDPRARVLILTTFGSDEYVFAALRAGASGFVLKRAEPAELTHAVRIVAAGAALVLPAAVRERIAAQHGGARNHWDRALARLSPREQQVLRLLATGRSNAEIAGELFLGLQTVKTHVTAVLTKLGARDRTQAVVIAYESGFAGTAGE